MKNRLFLCSAFLLLPLLAGCGEDTYSLEKFSVTHEASYQLWDNFDYGNLKVVYDETELEKNQYSVDLSEFHSSKVGESKITVSLKKSPNLAITLPVQVTNRTFCNLLCIGSSCIGDAIAYANELAQGLEGTTNVKVYGAIAEDASLNDHYAHFASGSASYTFLSYDSSSSWSEDAGKTLEEILSGSVSFDAICLSEESEDAGKKESFSNISRFALALTSFYESKGKSAPSLGYLLPWAYEDKAEINQTYYEDYGNDQNAMYQALVEACQDKVVSTGRFNFVLPLGTAIQNARSNGFVTLNDFTADGKNLDLTYGRYLASLCIVSKLTGFSASCFAYRGESGAEYVTEEEKATLDKAVDDAIANPYQVTKTEGESSAQE